MDRKYLRFAAGHELITAVVPCPMPGDFSALVRVTSKAAPHTLFIIDAIKKWEGAHGVCCGYRSDLGLRWANTALLRQWWLLVLERYRMTPTYKRRKAG